MIKDNLYLGLLYGLLAPTIGIAIFYWFNYQTVDFVEFISLSFEEKLLSPLLSLCCVINLGVFYLHIHLEKYTTSRGIIFATFIYGLIIVMLKFIL